MPAQDPNTRAHLEWLGFIQPNGLVVSAPALVKAGAILNRQDAQGRRCSRRASTNGWCSRAAIRSRPCGTSENLRLPSSAGASRPRGYAGTEESPVPTDLAVVLPEYDETLRPDFAVRERDPRNGASPWQLLVQVLADGQDFDKATSGGGGLEASPQGRAERLLRGTGVPAGVLFNGVALRLISAPRGESSGWMEFRFADLLSTAGRPLCSALRLLLREQRLLALPREERLAAGCSKAAASTRTRSPSVSRSKCSMLCTNFSADSRPLTTPPAANSLRQPLSDDGDRNDIYRGLLSVILRLVFSTLRRRTRHAAGG